MKSQNMRRCKLYPYFSVEKGKSDEKVADLLIST